MGDQRVGRIEDVTDRAVVLLELDQILHAELAFEVRHVADVRAAEGVDRLVVVADRENGVPALPGQLLEPRVLQLVRVLELVDQDVAEAVLVVLPQDLVAVEQLVAAQQQLGEVDHALAIALCVVECVELDEAAVVVVVDLDVLRPQARLLRTVDEQLQIARRIALVVDVVRLQQPLDRAQLVSRVEDLEGGRQAGIAVMRAQHPVAQAVKGADPHAAHVDRQHGGEPRQHFLRGLVGEGDRQHALRRDLSGLDQPRDAGRQHARLAAAGTGEDQGGLVGEGDRSELLLVQIGQQIHERSEV